MKVQDIIVEACTILSLNQEIEVLQDEEALEDTKLENAEIKKLYQLLKFSLRELYTNYLEMVIEKEITSENKTISLSELENYIRLLSVKYNNQPVKYKLTNKKINLPFDATYIIAYKGYPEITSLTDSTEDVGIFNLDVVILGLCAYYCLACGRFDEFDTYHSQYVDRAESIKSLKSIYLPNRSWQWQKKLLLLTIFL